MMIANNVQLFRPRGHRIPELSEVRSALRNLGFTIVNEDLRRYKAKLIANPVVRTFVLYERVSMQMTSFVVGVMALSGALLVLLGFMSGFDIPQLHHYRIGPIAGVTFVIFTILHLMFEVVIEQVPRWSVRSCDDRSVERVQRKVREVEHFAVMQVESMECWQRHMLCTMRRAGTGETVCFHVIL